MRTRLETWSRRYGYGLAVLAVAAATALFLAGRGDFATGQWGLLYLLVVVVVAGGCGTGPALLAAVLSFFAWDFFFIPPYGTFNVANSRDWLMLLVFLGVGVLMGIQTGRMADRESRALVREHAAEALHRLSAKLVSQATVEAMAETVLGEIVHVMQASAATLYVAQESGFRKYATQVAADAPRDAGPWQRLRRSKSHRPDPVSGRPAVEITVVDLPGGEGPFRALGEGNGLYLPLASPSGVAGIITASQRRDGRPYGAAETRLLSSLANLVAIFLERRQLESRVAQREADGLKSSLLSSVSHELKTPLTALAATVSNLLEGDVDWDEKTVRDELGAIVGDVTRLNASISNLLDLSRLEARAWEPHIAAYDLGEIIVAASDTLPANRRAQVLVDVANDLPPVEVDFAQWTRVMQNLLENALLYAGEGAAVRVGARSTAEGLVLWVED
ncbi:MAG: DUF4118 domain-containing protein, partial [Thermoleophilia bacterium]